MMVILTRKTDEQRMRNASSPKSTLGGASRGWRTVAPSLVLMAAFLTTPPAAALDAADLKATYAITIGGITVGRVDAEGRFSQTSYATAIRGSTSGVSRMVSDATALLAGTGRIAGTRVLPASYSLETSENGFETHVSMTMSGGSITDLSAQPGLLPAPDRIPVTPAHKHNVIDPVAAFFVVLDKPGMQNGPKACNRTLKVFDGWQRFDVKLYYKQTKAVDANSDSYAGEVIVCGARYVPVAGHRPDRESVKYMADNKRIELWLAPVKDTPYLVPYRILIGTAMGDLIIYATRFSTEAVAHRASVN